MLLGRFDDHIGRLEYVLAYQLQGLVVEMSNVLWQESLQWLQVAEERLNVACGLPTSEHFEWTEGYGNLWLVVVVTILFRVFTVKTSREVFIWVYL